MDNSGALRRAGGSFDGGGIKSESARNAANAVVRQETTKFQPLNTHNNKDTSKIVHQVELLSKANRNLCEVTRKRGRD